MPDDSRSPHRLIEAKPQRSRAGVFYLSAVALIVGVVAGFVWISRSDFVQPKPTLDAAVAETTVSATATEPPTNPTVAPTLQPAPTQAETPPHAAAAPTPRPTRTATPVPLLSEIEAVAGTGGATLWSADGKSLDKLPQGALLTVSERSSNGQWLLATAEDGTSGWVRSDELIVFNADRLATSDLNIVPMAPTPKSETSALASSADEAGRDATLPTPTPLAQNSGAMLDTAKQPIARIVLDGGRLNIRAGPGSDYRVTAKAFPQEIYALAGVDSTGAWVLLTVPQVADGVGWVATEYLDSEIDLTKLPISDIRSQAPTYVQTDDESVSRLQSQSSTADSDPVLAQLQPTPTPPTVLKDATGYSGRLVIQQAWGGSIYLYDLEAGELRLLTGGFDPSFSPDGQQVTFTRGGGENGVYIVDTKSGNETLLFGGRELLRSPKFSPGGEYIVFERGDETIQCKGDFARCRLTPPLPDGELPEHERQPSLARIRVDGSDYWDPMDMPYARVPDWNEDGIVYQSTAGLQLAQNEPNVEPVEVLFDPGKQYEMDPDWQPGGGSIVFQQKELSHWEIYSVNPDGSNLHALTKPQEPLAESFPSNVSPAWSPDGRHIVFLSNRTPENTAGDKWHVWIMDADGANQQQLPLELPITYTYVSEQMLDWGR